jgi:tetratricopeptide (TPR) repeat protein
MKRILLAALLLFHVLSVAAADKWTRVQSKNFTLVGNATENEIREVAEGLEVFRTVFSRFFSLKEGSSVATLVTVFRSDQAFKPYKPLYKGKPGNVAGYFHGGPDVNFIVLAADMDTPRVIYHEYVHRLMSDNLGKLPAWFQEGFAECFSTMEIEGRDKKVRLGLPIAEHVELLNQRRFMPLERLFAVEHGSPEYNEEEKQGVFYAESWALVHYMMLESEQRRAQFNQFLGALSRGIPPPQAFQETFKMELSAFQKTFEAYIQQRMAWNAFEINTPKGLDRSKDMIARVMSEAEAEAHLGSLLMRQDRLPEAETHIAKAVKLEPKLGTVQATMGQLLMEKGNNGEASEYLKRATELDPDNYLTHYYYATLLRSQKERTTEDREMLRRELKRAIELAPRFVEATEMLAAENLSRNIEIPQTIELLGKAIDIAPGRDYLVLQLAAAYAQTPGQRATARPLIQNLMIRPGLEPQLRQEAQNLLAYVERATAADTANREFAERRAREARPAAPAEAERVADATATVSTDTEPPRLAPAAPAAPAAPPAPDRPARVTETNSLPAGTARIRGTMTLLDCRNGVTLSLVVDGKTLKFHSTTPNNIKFTSFNSVVGQTISCGQLPGNGVPSVVVYQPREADGSIGNPLSVDFLETTDGATSGITANPETSFVRGLLTLVDCSKGVTFSVISEGKTLRFYSESASGVAFAKAPDADGKVACGPMPGRGLAVIVVYKPSTAAGDILGAPTVIQFEGN